MTLTPELASRMVAICNARLWLRRRAPHRVWETSVLTLALRPTRVQARYLGGIPQPGRHKAR